LLGLIFKIQPTPQTIGFGLDLAAGSTKNMLNIGWKFLRQHLEISIRGREVFLNS